jgi:hypothetical protein
VPRAFGPLFHVKGVSLVLSGVFHDGSRSMGKPRQLSVEISWRVTRMGFLGRSEQSREWFISLELARHFAGGDGVGLVQTLLTNSWR